ncbi:hypothetical protein QWY20_06595 [Alkalimonas sp. MEB108]|uniref:Secreted protein n=1 Tax=Alkalimonas cellulosilytica TaxID=3058395 RepID=A0ABU7J508_9GAMM|nr:hypothetical protein [Alkalimonas sp. MEB108]MEE2001117.1 hypothetical protein [Alkalimonas sp. MEB108]
MKKEWIAIAVILVANLSLANSVFCGPSGTETVTTQTTHQDDMAELTDLFAEVTQPGHDWFDTN